MTTRRIFLTFLSTCAAPLLVAGSLRAQDKPAPALDKEAEKARKKRAQQEAFAAMQRGEILPLTRILALAQAKVPGDVVEVEFKGGPVYEVKILTASGRLREVVLDARTGDVIKIENE